ncbi:hypothetical protein ACVWY2_008930 [Bradyrhizobium sp. JR6.1]
MSQTLIQHGTVKSRINAILRATSGNFLEQFDFFLFGFYASAIGQAFFPSGSETVSLLNTFGVFWLGALMRPVGAVVLGAYIDQIGRRKGLIITLSIMAIGTVIIAFCPGYATIGIAAPIVVLAGRLLQGFSAGVEVGGVSVYLAEIATPGNRGLYTSFQSSSQQVAIFVAATVGYLLNESMPAETVASWGVAHSVLSRLPYHPAYLLSSSNTGGNPGVSGDEEASQGPRDLCLGAGQLAHCRPRDDDGDPDHNDLLFRHGLHAHVRQDRLEAVWPGRPLGDAPGRPDQLHLESNWRRRLRPYRSQASSAHHCRACVGDRVSGFELAGKRSHFRQDAGGRDDVLVLFWYL